MAEGSIGIWRTSEKVLNIDCQKLSSFEQNQNICERVAGVCLHRSQMGSILGVNFASLTLDQWRRCITLNWITVCRKQIEEEYILSKALSQIFSGSSNPKSPSHWIFSDVKGSKLYVFSREYMFPIIPLEPELNFRMSFKRESGGRDGKWVNDFDIKLWSCRNLKKNENLGC